METKRPLHPVERRLSLQIRSFRQAHQRFVQSELAFKLQRLAFLDGQVASSLLASLVGLLTEQHEPAFAERFVLLVRLLDDFRHRVPEALASVQIQSLQDFQIVDANDLVMLRLSRPSDQVHQPADRRLGARLRLAALLVFELERFAAGDDPQHVASVGVERFDSAIDHDRQMSDGRVVERIPLHCWRLRLAADPQRQERDHHDRHPTGRTVDDLRRRCGLRLASTTIQEPQQRHRKLKQHPDRHDHAGNVRNHPTAVRHHLQRRVFLALRLRVAALIKRLASVPQRIVHPDVMLEILAARFIDDANVRRVIPGRARAEIICAVHVFQLDRVRLVIAAEPQREVVLLVADLDRLGLVLFREMHRDEVRPDLLAAVPLRQSDVRARHVHLAHRLDAGRRLERHQHARLADASRRHRDRRAVLHRTSTSVLVVFQHLDVERQQFVRDLVFADAAGQPCIGDDDVRFGIRAGGLDDRQLGRADVAGVVRRLTFFERNLSFDCHQADKQLAEHHQPDAGVQQHDAGALLEDHHAADQQHNTGQRPLQQLPQNPHRRIVEHIAPHPQPGQQQTGRRATGCFDPKRNRLPRLCLAGFRRVDANRLVDRVAPNSRQHKLEQQPQRVPRDPAIALQAVRIGTAHDHQPRRQQTESDHADSGPQPIPLRLCLEPNAVSGQQIQKHHDADQSAAGKGNDHPIGNVRLAGEERRRKENLQINPRQIAAEVFFDHFPNVRVHLRHRPGQHQKRRHRQERHRQLQRRQRPHQLLDQRPDRDVRFRCRAILEEVCGCHDWSPDERDFKSQISDFKSQICRYSNFTDCTNASNFDFSR